MTRCGPSKRRPTVRAARSRQPRRRCCGPTASRGWHGRRTAARSPPSACSSSNATLYLIGDAKASKLLRPIFLALLSEVVDAAYELANRRGGRLELPLLICLDEAGNVAPLPNLAEIASTAPSHNIQLISIFHDLAQARSRYRQQAETVVNSHRARMLLPGVADLDTLRYFSGLVGEEERRELTRTSGRGGSHALVRHRRTPLISPEALRQLPEGHALLLYGRLAPVRVRLRTWFGNRRVCGDWRVLRMRPPIEDPDSAASGSRISGSTSAGCASATCCRCARCWWENPLQVETLAALAAWVERYDSGEWDDPPGKLALLYDLERVAGMLRDGNDPFYPERDRPAFLRFLEGIA